MGTTGTTSDNLKLTDLYVFDTTSATIRVPDTSVVEESVKEDTRASLGPDIDMTTSTPIGRMIEWWTQNFKNVINVNVQNANQLLISSAAGQQLDCIAEWFGLHRKGKRKTTVTCRVGGIAGTKIYSGSRARDKNGESYILTNEVVIGDDGYNDNAMFTNTRAGEYPCSKGSLVIVETQIYGWNTVTNLTDGATGRLVETDESLRDRIIQFKDEGVGFLSSIRTAIENVDGVNSACVIENNTGDELDVHGVALDPHSIFICVDGITTGEAGNEKLIGDAIFNTKPCGTGYTKLEGLNKNNGDTLHSPEIDDGYGNKYKVYFHDPEVCKIKTRVQVKNRNYTGTDIVGDVKKAIMNWADTVMYTIGEDVYASDVINAIEDNVGGVVVINGIVNNAGTDSDVFENASFVAVAASQKASFYWYEGGEKKYEIYVEVAD